MISLRCTAKGFTLVELMIASTVFAVVLLLLTSGIIQIGRVFFKGTTAASTQEVTRTIVSTISQSIQLNGSVPDIKTADKLFCIGGRRFIYNLGNQLTTDAPSSANRGIAVDTAASCTATATPTSTPRELLGPRMRLVKMDITSTTSEFYTITVRVVYGDKDLLCSPSVVNSCTSDATMTSGELQSTDLMCKSGQAGTQFCSTTELTTTVQRRIQ